MSTVITPFQGTDPFSTATFNNRISQINTGFSYISNPNLLDNWYFGNPVNQRGQTSYTGVGYGIDRWKILTDSATLAISNDGITLHRNGGDQWLLAEQMEPSIVTNFVGKHFTASVLTTQGLVVLDVPSAFTSETSVTDPKGVCVWVNTTGIVLFGTINDSMTLIAAKLELGSQQTLAHQDADGNWVLNEVPDYGEQLARCQRYALECALNGYVADAQIVGMGSSETASVAHIVIPTPNTMRTLPTITWHDLTLRQGGQYFTPTAISVWRISAIGVTMLVTCSGLTVGASCELRTSTNNGRAFLSADL